MHRENDKRMGLLSYIMGNKKGREAHSLEREAMQDSFLADALDGYDSVQDSELETRLLRMEKRIEEYDSRGKYIPDDIVAASAMERPAVPAMEMCDRAVTPPEQDGFNRPAKPRRGYVFWISAAAVMLFACTISYKLGLTNAEYVAESIAVADAYERSGVDSAEAAADAPYRSTEMAPQRTAAESRVHSKEPLRKDADELPCPSNGYKAYYEYVYKEMKEFVSFDAGNISGVVVLNFDIDNGGRPSNIEITESTSEAVAQKLIDIVRKGARWSGHGQAESFVFIY